MSNAVAVILARAGSKGVPGKNVAIVGGKPCVLWSIESAVASGIPVIVSTDDERAKSVAIESGVGVIDRPDEFAHDRARVDDAARHAILEHERLTHSTVDIIVILYANVPIRPHDLISNAVNLLRTSGCDSVQSYQGVGKYHPWWTAKLDEQSRVRPWEGDVLNHGVFRRQDLPHALIPDGGVIALTRAALFGEIPGVPEGPHAFFGHDRRGIVNPEGSVVDIDSKYDLLVADAMLKENAK